MSVKLIDRGWEEVGRIYIPNQWVLEISQYYNSSSGEKASFGRWTLWYHSLSGVPLLPKVCPLQALSKSPGVSQARVGNPILDAY